MFNAITRSSIVRFLMISIAFAIFTASGCSNDNTTHNYPTGARPLTEEEKKWEAENLKIITDVEMNDLARERIQNTKETEDDTSAGNMPWTSILLQNTEEASSPMTAADAIPASADNSTLPSFPEIRNQESQGSCVSFSIAYYQLTHEMGLAHGWNNKDVNNDEHKYSPKFLYNLVNGGYNYGSGWYFNYAVLMNHGAPSWKDYPYQGYTDPETNYREWPLNGKIWLKALNQICKGYSLFNCYDPTQKDLDLIKRHLLNGHVLVGGTASYSWQFTTIKDRPGTRDDAVVGQSAITHVEGFDGGHSITIVGYDDTIWIDVNNNNAVDTGEKGAFKIANSWGNYWANEGYCWVSYDALHAVSNVADGPGGEARNNFFFAGLYNLEVNKNYKPAFVGKVTANHANRSQMRISLGISDSSKNVPLISYPTVLDSAGGEYSFDGTNTACDATFYFDYTKLSKNMPADNNKKNFYMLFNDTVQNNGAGIVKNFVITDTASGTTYRTTSNVPQTVDFTEAQFAVKSVSNTINLVNNGSFELGPQAPEKWVLADEHSVVTFRKKEGEYSLKISGSGYIAPAYQVIPIKPNSDYLLTVWIKVGQGTSGTLVFDTEDEFDETCQFAIVNDCNTEWTQYTGIFNSGPKTEVKLRMFAESNFNGTCYFDDIILSEIKVNRRTTLERDKILYPGEILESRAHNPEQINAYMILQPTDGNLVVYKGIYPAQEAVIWKSNTSTNNPANACFLIMQSDGNLVLYEGTADNSYPLWSSMTQGTKATFLKLNGKTGNPELWSGSPSLPYGLIKTLRQ